MTITDKYKEHIPVEMLESTFKTLSETLNIELVTKYDSDIQNIINTIIMLSNSYITFAMTLSTSIYNCMLNTKIAEHVFISLIQNLFVMKQWFYKINKEYHVLDSIMHINKLLVFKTDESKYDKFQEIYETELRKYISKLKTNYEQSDK